MSRKSIEKVGLFLLAIIFSFGLMFAFIELPVVVDDFIQNTIATPQSDPAYDAMRIDVFYQVYEIRLIGYLCLGIIFLLIILGFTTRRSGWAFAGSIGLFLPVFATFAHSMFYLAGLGLLNVILFPVLDNSIALLDLGKIVLLPYWILMWFFSLFHWYAQNFLLYFFMGTGAFIFGFGVYAWLLSRYDKSRVAINWIYKYSRHPQYLGWIIWSYGLMLYGPTLNEMKKSWGWNGSLPWLLSTLVIIGLCLLEEIKMQDRAGKDYQAYRDRTPFLLPLPKIVEKIFTAPLQLILRRRRPETPKQVGIAILIYACIFMGLSAFWVEFPNKHVTEQLAGQQFNQTRVDALLLEIRKPQQRRHRSTKPYGELLSMGPQAYASFLQLFNDDDPDVREFAVQAVYQFKIREAIPSLIDALQDSDSRVVKSSIFGLGEMQAFEAEKQLFSLLGNLPPGIPQDLVLTALSKLKCTQIMPYLQYKLSADKWFQRSNALRAMVRVDPEAAKPFLYQSLQDDHPNVRQEVVTILLEILPEDAVPHLEKVLNDENWEVRFYAKQAISLIKEKQQKNEL
ncbi:MAG: HEAT repeat domain-containing protein [Deferribacteres bacterium]|nr:HEAT repeat domain-containing protein [candidate division KSB1 bacterium]MCB9500672.1 HEAT repeat domain-containing protein [Deferribacteres bacterium]